MRNDLRAIRRLTREFRQAGVDVMPFADLRKAACAMAEELELLTAEVVQLRERAARPYAGMDAAERRRLVTWMLVRGPWLERARGTTTAWISLACPECGLTRDEDAAANPATASWVNPCGHTESTRLLLQEVQGWADWTSGVRDDPPGFLRPLEDRPAPLPTLRVE